MNKKDIKRAIAITLGVVAVCTGLPKLKDIGQEGRAKDIAHNLELIDLGKVVTLHSSTYVCKQVVMQSDVTPTALSTEDGLYLVWNVKQINK